MFNFGIDDFAKIFFSLSLLAPGFIIIRTRSQYMTGRMKSHTEAGFNYALVSFFYAGIVALFFFPASTSNWTSRGYILYWIVFVVAFPWVLGAAAGIAFRWGLGARVAGFFGLTLVDPIPTAWDYKFGRYPKCWVIVVLKSSEVIAGYLGEESFASSDGERDLYLSHVYLIPPGLADWIDANRSAWIPGSEIARIEFLYDQDEVSDDK